jgi:hypothetical protein
LFYGVSSSHRKFILNRYPILNRFLFFLRSRPHRRLSKSFIAVERDLSRSGLREARVAGDALSLLHLPRAAATRLAMWCGLDLGEWVDEACCEQGVVIDDTRVTT